MPVLMTVIRKRLVATMLKVGRASQTGFA